MTKNRTDDASRNLEQTCDSNYHDNKMILGRKLTLHELDNWRQVCIRWCHQQQQAEGSNCSMYCFKYKNDDSKPNESLPPSEEPSTASTTTAATATTTDLLTTIKSYMSDSLKCYSFVVVKGTDSTTDDYIKAHQYDQQLTSTQSIHEINVGAKAETAINNAELMVKKTHDFSKELLHTWQNNNSNKWMNGFAFSGTFRIMKDRAVKIIDVAKGKYDNDADNLDKKSPNQDPDHPKTSDQDTHDDGTSSKDDT